MVVIANCYGLVTNWSADCARGRHSSSAIHLYPILMERSKVLESILTIAAALLIIHFVLLIKYEVNNEVLVPIALGLMLIGLLSRWLSSKIIWLWFKLAEGMGYVMSRVILSIVFFLFLFPIALLYRFFNPDALKLRNTDDSTYSTRNHEYRASDLENPW